MGGVCAATACLCKSNHFFSPTRTKKKDCALHYGAVLLLRINETALIYDPVSPLCPIYRQEQYHAEITGDR